jgi:hypothetical protein
VSLAGAPWFRYLAGALGGGLAERLRTGLQIREDRFDSDTHLQSPPQSLCGPGSAPLPLRDLAALCHGAVPTGES